MTASMQYSTGAQTVLRSDASHRCPGGPPDTGHCIVMAAGSRICWVPSCRDQSSDRYDGDERE